MAAVNAHGNPFACLLISRAFTAHVSSRFLLALHWLPVAPLMDAHWLVTVFSNGFPTGLV